MISESRPRVSVIVPCFNNETTICETIESVISQTNPNWELICVDDGSMDKTVDIIKEYCNCDNRIRLLFRDSEPKGGSHCRNIGAFSAQGDYLIFLDGDDLLSETCVENRLKCIDETEYEFAIFPMGFFSGNNPKNISKGTQLDERINYLYYYASGNAGWTVTSPIVRKTFFESIGGFDVSFPRLQDIEYNFRAIIESGGRFKLEYNADFDCFYRYGAIVSSSMSSKLRRALEAYKQFLDLVMSYQNNSLMDNKKMFSKAILNIYCNGYILYDSLVMKWDKKTIMPTWLKNNEKYLEMTKADCLLFQLLHTTSFSSRINYFLSRIISKVARKSFVR